MGIELLHMDCMAYMADQPDNSFDLAKAFVYTTQKPLNGNNYDKGIQKK